MDASDALSAPALRAAHERFVTSPHRTPPGVRRLVAESWQRVAVPWLGSSCGTCGYCVSGWETLCESQVNSGYCVDGCYAEYTVANAGAVVQVPDGVTSFDAAPLTCAGVTTYKALKVAHVNPAERVAVFGIGGLGHLALPYARLVGGFVTAVDLEPSSAR